MTSVLITRPADVAETLANILERRGYMTVIEPMLMVKPLLGNPLPDIDNLGAVMVTSGYALLVFEQRPQELAALYRLPCYCVGPRTAERARRIGFHQVSFGEGDGFALAQLIANNLDRNARLLHIAERSPNAKTRSALESVGYRVHEWPVYETVPVSELSERTIELLKAGKLNAAALFSPRTAQVFRALIGRYTLQACCKGVSAICLSRPIADMLAPIAWRHLLVAAKPTEDSLVASLVETCPVTKA